MPCPVGYGTKSRTARLAASFWYCQSNEPFNVTLPALTVTLMWSCGTTVFHFNRLNGRLRNIRVGALEHWRENGPSARG